MTVVLAGAGTAAAATKTLWLSATYAPLVQEMSGVANEQLDAEDDATEWQTVTQFATGSTAIPSTDILGFTCAFDTAIGDWCYHRIYVAPAVTQQLFGAIPLDPSATYEPIWTRLQDGTEDPYYGAMAIMTLIHEAYHNRLYSADESLVNACALRDFGYWLDKDFQVPAAVTSTTYVQQRKAYRKRIRVKHHRRVNGRTRTWYTRKWVTRHRMVSVPLTVTNPNPLYETLVADAQTFYNSQPPPYNAGTCTAPAVS